MCGGGRDINNAARHEWSPVIDCHDHGTSVAVIGHAHPRAEWQRAVSSSQFVGIEPLATRGLRRIPIRAGESILAACAQSSGFFDRSASISNKPTSKYLHLLKERPKFQTEGDMHCSYPPANRR